MRRPFPFSVVFGLLVGFSGGIVAIETIARSGDEPETGERLEAVLGHPNFEEYCGRDGGEFIVTPASDDPAGDGRLGWSCSGSTQGLSETIAIDVDDVCRTQFEVTARARLFDLDDPDGWRCISDP